MAKSKIQIGIIGSMADIAIGESIQQLAREVGKGVANQEATLLYGFEGDFNSISLIAALEAEKNGGETVAFIWGSDKPNLNGVKSTRIITGQHRGGGREFSFILSCDSIICISGGSGTLMEMAMAYQAGIPLVALSGTSGWSDNLKGQFLDNRKREKVIEASNAKEAVKKAILLAKNKK